MSWDVFQPSGVNVWSHASRDDLGRRVHRHGIPSHSSRYRWLAGSVAVDAGSVAVDTGVYQES